MKFRYKHYARSLLVTTAVIFLTLPMNVWAEEDSSNVTVQYENLRELLIKGNPTLKEEYDDYEDNLAAYQEMWDIMKFEQGNLEDLAEEAEDNGEENAANYSSNADMLNNSARRIYQQLDNLKSTKSTRNLEKSADSYTMTAQTLMNSYNQLVENQKVQEKKVEASQATYNETIKKEKIGSATEADVLSAQENLAQATNSLESIKEQASQMKGKLLTMLGLSEEEQQVVVETIPEPDMAAIENIDVEYNKAKAVGNDSTVQSARHTNAKSTADINQRFKQVAEAEGTATADIQQSYEALMVKKTQYQAALEAYENALLVYRSLQNKKQAGLLSNAEYLQGEADYLETEAQKEISSMNLVQAYESYCWEVEGVA